MSDSVQPMVTIWLGNDVKVTGKLRRRGQLLAQMTRLIVMTRSLATLKTWRQARSSKIRILMDSILLKS